MALILAIEPDQRQAAQLARLIKSRVGAELVLADTTEQALGAIGNRVPDLVLVPALLAPQDDATLATALRVIAAAAHVQMLTIPVLAPARGATEPLGMLARLRRRRTDPVPPDGCDPDVFGDQIAAYLAEAAAERAINESDLEIDLSAFRAQAARDSKDTQEFSLNSPDLSVHVVLGERSIDEPAADEPPTAPAERFVVAPAVERASVEPAVETALFAVTTKDSNDTKDPTGFFQDGPAQSVPIVPGDERAEPIEQLTTDESPIVAADVFALPQPDAERTIGEGDLETPLVALTTKDTEDTKEPSQDGPDLCVHSVLAGEPAAIEEVEVAAALDVVATSAEEPAARLEVSKPREVSEAPWFGPLRRWPDLEGEETVDQLTVFTAQDAADTGVQTGYFTAEEPAAIDELPKILAAMDEPAAVVVEEMPIDVQEALPAIDMVPLDDPAPGALLELWMPLSFGSTRSWPALEGVWSEARPAPPAPVHADPPAVAAALPAPSTTAERVPPQDVPAVRPEWIELIESLRQDVKRLRSERTPAPVVGARSKETPLPVSRPSPSLRRAAPGDVEMTPKRRAKSAKPAQDEWGFFDPEQCGFAALLAKLDEITQVNDGP